MSVLTPNSIDTDANAKVGVNHVGYTFSSVRELLETYERLKGLGITPYWQVHHGLTLSTYYRDPDGNRMEFQVDCFANAEEAHAYMQSEVFTLPQLIRSVIPPTSPSMRRMESLREKPLRVHFLPAPR